MYSGHHQNVGLFREGQIACTPCRVGTHCRLVHICHLPELLWAPPCRLPALQLDRIQEEPWLWRDSVGGVESTMSNMALSGQSFWEIIEIWLHCIDLLYQALFEDFWTSQAWNPPDPSVRVEIELWWLVYNPLGTRVPGPCVSIGPIESSHLGSSQLYHPHG